MTKELKNSTGKAVDKNGKNDEFKPKLFGKSGWPRTVKDHFKFFVNIIVNFFA
jgi:hypothetical protein